MSNNSTLPAFPVAEDHKVADAIPWTCGLTKRELFAAMAMQGLLANPSVDVDSTKLAGMCLLQTDALLAKLEEKKEGKE